MSTHLQRAGLRASSYPFFLAAKLAVYQQHHGLSDQQLADRLECPSLDDLAHLRLCRTPTNEDEIILVASHGSANAGCLASILREC